jgi:RES domain-containing protein
MTPLPPALAGAARPRSFTAWRLERTVFYPGWMQGIGAEKVGGRWSPKGRAVIYASLDPATTILEVAVHHGFEPLDTVPHTMLSMEIQAPRKVRVVQASEIANPRWLLSGSISAAQQAFGASLLDQHPFVLIPSAVSTHSWNLLIDAGSAAGLFRETFSEPFALDTRLNPA